MAQYPEVLASEVRRRWAAGFECQIIRQVDIIVAYRWDVPADVGAVYLPYFGTRVRPAPGDVLT